MDIPSCLSRPYGLVLVFFGVIGLLGGHREIAAAELRPPDRGVSYVPAPQPAKTGRYLVGAVMCPLWNDGRRWGDIARFPDREPLLGWYDEGTPEVTDWEITWALDHGISFFLVCWYRQPGTGPDPVVRPVLDHWVKDGLPRSRYRDQFKFALMWENANQQLSVPSSESDFLTKLVPFWIETYFRRSDYLLIDGKPVFSVYNPERFVTELGGEERAAVAIEKMRVACVRAGFKGLHLLGQSCWGSPAELQRQTAQIRRLGLDASWAYHWPTFTGAFAGERRPTGAQAIAAQEHLWRTQPQPNLLTLSMGWDEAPWRFKYSKIQWRLTPGEFKTLAEKAKTILDQRTGDGLESRVVLLDNWNEFGEGHYIFPTKGSGFGYLDAVRAVFAPAAGEHRDVTPAEIGRGPYDAAYRASRDRRSNAGPRPASPQ